MKHLNFLLFMNKRIHIHLLWRNDKYYVKNNRKIKFIWNGLIKYEKNLLNLF